MKILTKVFLGLACLSVLSFADDKKIENLERIFKGINAQLGSVVKEFPTQIDGLVAIVVTNSEGTPFPLYASKDYKYIFKFEPLIDNRGEYYPDGLKEELEKITSEKKLINDLELLEKVKEEVSPELIISISNDKRKEDIYVFTDPLCPFCQNEMNSSQFDLILKKFNVHFLITPIISLHGQEAINISEYIYHKVKDLKTNEEKISLLKKYISKGIELTKSEEKEISSKLTEKLTLEFSSNNIKEFNISPRMKEMIDSLFASGLIPGTPYKVLVPSEEK